MDVTKIKNDVAKAAETVVPGFEASISDDGLAFVLVVKDPEGILPMKKFVDLTKRVQYILRENGAVVSNKEMFYDGERASMYWYH